MRRADTDHTARRDFDWEAMKERLPAMLRLEESPAELAQVFRERAAELARVPQRGEVASGTPHLEFNVGEVRFAVALHDVRSIVAPSRVTRLPGAPDALAHVIHVEGRLVALVDLAVSCHAAVPVKARSQKPIVMLLETSGSPLGLWVSKVHDLRSIDPTRLAQARGGPGSEFLCGITSDMSLVLSVPQLVTSLREATRASQSPRSK
ncbi:MAG TPA: chemotaxis protein CheW [Polyangiales bacterium]|nr:chemotaxis protein CheW [Polyangiales bacterium]